LTSKLHRMSSSHQRHIAILKWSLLSCG
jgi:hypothetical protein